jgi:hypothetical protein
MPAANSHIASIHRYRANQVRLKLKAQHLAFWSGIGHNSLVRGAQRASPQVAPDVPLRRDRAYARHRTGVKVEARSPEAERNRGGVVAALPNGQLQSLGDVCGARSGRQGNGSGGAGARTNAQERTGVTSARSWVRRSLLAAIVLTVLNFGFGKEEEMRVRLILNGAGWGVVVSAQRASPQVAPDVPLRHDRAYARHRTGVKVEARSPEAERNRGGVVAALTGAVSQGCKTSPPSKDTDARFVYV